MSKKLENKRLLFIGGGNMAEGILKGILDAGIIDKEEVIVSELITERREYIRKRYGVTVLNDSIYGAEISDIIILAVKPQHISKVLEDIAPEINENKMLISIAAGIYTKSILLGLREAGGFKDYRIVRVMPNLPITVGEGMAEISKGDFALSEDVEIAKEIFGSCGKAIEVEEEKMHAVTAVAGSGPGYMLLVIEALADAGVRQGIPFDKAVMLATQTMLGTAKMVLETGEHPAKLKAMVSSPGGTTIEGLYELENRGVRAAFISAVEKTAKKSEELGKGK